MFELSIATKYLLPKWRQLSVSIISVISTLVISLVVWLILVFFSVTNGLEKMWIDKLVLLTAPVRVSPTDAYYESYYYNIDSISSASNYTLKSLEEKLAASSVDPYNAAIDEEIPAHWPPKESIDPVKALFASVNTIKGVKGLSAAPYEVAPVSLKITLHRPYLNDLSLLSPPSWQDSEATLSHSALTLPLDPQHKGLLSTLLPLSNADLTNLLKQDPSLSKRVLDNATITSLKTPLDGWVLPKRQLTLPPQGSFKALAIFKEQTPTHLLFPKKEDSITSLQQLATDRQLKTEVVELSSTTPEVTARFVSVPWVVESGVEVIPTTTDLQPESRLILQGREWKGPVSLNSLNVEAWTPKAEAISPPWIAQDAAGNLILPSHPKLGDGVLLPKNFKEAGVLVGDSGFIAYDSPSVTSIQEMRLPIYVAGFYDQGILSMGGKFLIVSRELASLVHSSTGADTLASTSGINVRMDNYKDASFVKAALDKQLKEQGLDRYFTIETYQDFEFTKDFIRELQSQKNLFSLLAAIIILVACSNIISMLIILVNDKRKEIGILRAMGATTTSIAAIFGFSGLMMGVLGSLFGVIASLITLHYLPDVIHLLNAYQGFDAFNPLFYGRQLPTDLSFEALRFVISATVITSLLSGLVPAIKACLVRPSETLRSE